MGKQTVIYPYNDSVVLLGNKKEWTVDTCNIVNDSQNHCVKWEKSISKVYILYDSIHKTFLKWQNYSYGEQISGRQGLGLGWLCGCKKGSVRGVFGGFGTILYSGHGSSYYKRKGGRMERDGVSACKTGEFRIRSVAQLVVTNSVSWFWSLYYGHVEETGIRVHRNSIVLCNFFVIWNNFKIKNFEIKIQFFSYPSHS